MKKKIIIILISISIMFLAVLISGIMLRTKVEKLNENFNKNIEETGYIEIKHLGSAQNEITDANIINAIIQELNCMEVKKRHPYKEFISDCKYWGTSYKIAFGIKGRDVKDGNVLFDLTIHSNEYIELNGDEYRIKNDTYIYDILDCYSHTGYSAHLPDITYITSERIVEFNLHSGIEYTEEDFFAIYGEILNSEYIYKEEGVKKIKSITKDEFVVSDNYMGIKTIDEEFIDMYFVGDKIYISYKKEEFEGESCIRVREKYGNIISNLEIDSYYVYE